MLESYPALNTRFASVSSNALRAALKSERLSRRRRLIQRLPGETRLRREAADTQIAVRRSSNGTSNSIWSGLHQLADIVPLKLLEL